MAVATERELVESTIYDDFVSSFSEAANRLKVGDSLEADALGAKRAGWCGVWLDRRGREEKSDSVGVARIRSLTELPARLDLDSL